MQVARTVREWSRRETGIGQGRKAGQRVPPTTKERPRSTAIAKSEIDPTSKGSKGEAIVSFAALRDFVPCFATRPAA
jgi:hypothetical protein